MKLSPMTANALGAAVIVLFLAAARPHMLCGETAPQPASPSPTSPVPKKNEASVPPAEKTSPEKTTDSGKKRQIKVVAGHWQYDNKKMVHVLTPGGAIKQVTIREVGEDYEMVADRIEYDDRNSIATGTGHLHFSDPDTTIVGDLLVVDFDQKKAVLTGNVKMNSHGKETDNNTDEELPLKEQYRKKKTVVTCDKLEYWYKEKRAVATGHLKFEQGDRHGAAGVATYLEKDDVLLLEKDVEVTNKKGETAKAPQVVIDNKKDTMTADQGVEIMFFVEEEGEEGAGKEPAKKTGQSKEKPGSQKHVKPGAKDATPAPPAGKGKE